MHPLLTNRLKVKTDLADHTDNGVYHKQKGFNYIKLKRNIQTKSFKERKVNPQPNLNKPHACRLGRTEGMVMLLIY